MLCWWYRVDHFAMVQRVYYGCGIIKELFGELGLQLRKKQLRSGNARSGNSDKNICVHFLAGCQSDQGALAVPDDCHVVENLLSR